MGGGGYDSLLSTAFYTLWLGSSFIMVVVMMVIIRGPTEGACLMAVPVMSTRPRTSALRMPSTHPAIRNANHS